MEVFATRFPIFDVHMDVFAYRVAYQNNLQDYYQSVREKKTDNDLMEFIGLADILGSSRGLIDFNRELLIAQYPLLFDQAKIIVCIPADLEVDSQVLDCCSKLRSRGYHLALNDFRDGHLQSPLLEFADIVNVECLGMTRDNSLRICQACRDRMIVLLGDSIQDEQQFHQARADGFNLFGGRFFRQPAVRDHADLAPNKLAALHLLKDVSQADQSPQDLAALVQRDVGLTFQLLKLVNSVWYGLSHRVTSIQHALVLLGDREVHRWASMMALIAVGNDKPSELLTLSLIRAKFAEQLAMLTSLKKQASELFLLGMFSVVDAIMDRKMEDVLTEVALAKTIKQTLLRQPSDYTPIYKAMLAYEHGQWVLFAGLAGEMGIDPNSVPPLFHQALDWSQKAYLVVTSQQHCGV